MNIKLEDGQKWRTRDGTIVALIYEPADDWFSESVHGFVYCEDDGAGKFLVFGHEDHPFDLMELVK